jgi:hypothetical protein
VEEKPSTVDVEFNNPFVMITNTSGMSVMTWQPPTYSKFYQAYVQSGVYETWIMKGSKVYNKLLTDTESAARETHEQAVAKVHRYVNGQVDESILRIKKGVEEGLLVVDGDGFLFVNPEIVDKWNDFYQSTFSIN